MLLTGSAARQSLSVNLWSDAEELASRVVRLLLAQPHPTEQHQDVSVKCLGQDGVKKRVCTRVQRVEDHKQHLWRIYKFVIILIKNLNLNYSGPLVFMWTRKHKCAQIAVVHEHFRLEISSKNVQILHI